MRNTHTPGPWIIEQASELDGEYEIYTEGNEQEEGKRIASIAGGLGFTGDECIESSANARLIASAPLLLEMLKEAQMFIGRFDEWDDEETELINKIGQAIAQAEGKETPTP